MAYALAETIRHSNAGTCGTRTDTAAEALKTHADDAKIHKTSEQIRADIVEDDIPATISRTTDVETKDADTLAKAKEYTDGAVAGKADAQAMADALAGKVDKADGKDLMTAAEREKLSGIEARANAYTHPGSHPADMITDTAGKVVMTAAEREKLSGIEAGANAYTLPAATASTLGGVKAGDNVTIAEDGTLSAAADLYELPKASATTLGGVKIGNNLSMREDGTLDAVGGGTATVSPDSGNTLEQRENGLFVPAGSGGGDISGLEIGTQNLAPVVSLYSRELSGIAELQTILPILSNPAVMGNGQNRAFALSNAPFTGRYITVDQPLISLTPGWQVMVFGINRVTAESFDTFTMNGGAWPENYPATYDLKTDQIASLGFIIRKADDSTFELDDLNGVYLTVCRGNKTIGAVEPYRRTSETHHWYTALSHTRRKVYLCLCGRSN